MADRDPERAAFAAAIDHPDDQLELARAALHIAAEEYPGLEVERYLGELDRHAADGPRLAPDASLRDRVEALGRFFGGELGFVGNRAAYRDPRNSFLNEVLDRRTGIPITLSLVYIEIGRRLGLSLFGVGLPGHFVVGAMGGAETLYVDAFDGGTILDEVGLADLLARAFGQGTPLQPGWLRPVGPRQFLFRMLNNLKNIYVEAEDRERALAATERMLLLEPGSAGDRRDRGMLLARLGRFKEAVAELRRYLEGGQAGDAAEVERQIAWLERMLTRLN